MWRELPRVLCQKALCIFIFLSAVCEYACVDGETGGRGGGGGGGG